MKLTKDTVIWFVFITAISCFLYANKANYDQSTQAIIIISNSIILIAYLIAACILYIIGHKLNTNDSAFDSHVDISDEVYESVDSAKMKSIIFEIKRDISIALFCILGLFLYAYILTDDIVGVVTASGASGTIFHGLSLALDGYSRKVLEYEEVNSNEE